MNSEIVIITDFGVMRLSKASIDFIGGDEGYEIINNKRIRNKSAKSLRHRMAMLEQAAHTMAWVRYEYGIDTGKL